MPEYIFKQIACLWFYKSEREIYTLYTYLILAIYSKTCKQCENGYIVFFLKPDRKAQLWESTNLIFRVQSHWAKNSISFINRSNVATVYLLIVAWLQRQAQSNKDIEIFMYWRHVWGRSSRLNVTHNSVRPRHVASHNRHVLIETLPKTKIFYFHSSQTNLMAYRPLYHVSVKTFILPSER